MNYQSFFSIFFLFILTINYSLTSTYSDQTNDISKYKLDQSYKNILQKISDEYGGHHKSRRQSELFPIRTNFLNRNKQKTRFLKYDFLLHQWTLRNMPSQ